MGLYPLQSMEMFGLPTICPLDNDCGVNFSCRICNVRRWTCNEDECTIIDCRNYNAGVFTNLVFYVPFSLSTMMMILQADLIILATYSS